MTRERPRSGERSHGKTRPAVRLRVSACSRRERSGSAASPTRPVESSAARTSPTFAASPSRRVAEFRARHWKPLQALFLEVLVLCRAAGLRKVGRLSLDGTKIPAFSEIASRHCLVSNRAMSDDRRGPEAERLPREIHALLARADRADAADEEQFGDLADDEIPDERQRRETRMAKILAAKAALEEAARQQARDHVEPRAAAGRHPRTHPDDAVPDPKAPRNFTDPESKILRTSNTGFDPCGNAQAVANEQQLLLAADVTDQANDVRQTLPMTEQAIANLAAAGVDENIRAFTVDTGDFRADNLLAVEANERTDRSGVPRDGSSAAQRGHSPVARGSPTPNSDGEGTDGSTQPNPERPCGIRAPKGDHRTGPVLSK